MKTLIGLFVIAISMTSLQSEAGITKLVNWVTKTNRFTGAISPAIVKSEIKASFVNLDEALVKNGEKTVIRNIYDNGSSVEIKISNSDYFRAPVLTVKLTSPTGKVSKETLDNIASEISGAKIQPHWASQSGDVNKSGYVLSVNLKEGVSTPKQFEDRIGQISTILARELSTLNVEGFAVKAVTSKKVAIASTSK